MTYFVKALWAVGALLSEKNYSFKKKHDFFNVLFGKAQGHLKILEQEGSFASFKDAKKLSFFTL